MPWLNSKSLDVIPGTFVKCDSGYLPVLEDWKSVSVCLTTGAASRSTSTNAWFLHGPYYQKLPVKRSMGVIKATSNPNTKLSNNLSFFIFIYPWIRRWHIIKGNGTIQNDECAVSLQEFNPETLTNVCPKFT